MRKLRILLWAAVHHDLFWACYIAPPISFRWIHTGETTKIEIVLWRSPDIRLPWKVEADYRAAHKTPIDFDDIPF